MVNRQGETAGLWRTQIKGTGFPKGLVRQLEVTNCDLKLSRVKIPSNGIVTDFGSRSQIRQYLWRAKIGNYGLFKYPLTKSG